LISGFEKVASVVVSVVNGIRSLIDLVRNNPVVRGIGGLIDSAFGGFRADGGSVSAGTPYIVGERGAELFVPSSNGSIVPNGGMGSTINITVNGAIDAEGTARTIVDVLNRSNARGTLGANRLTFA
jgi:phage-related minor tail protein